MYDPPLTLAELDAFDRLITEAAARDEGPSDPPCPEFQLVRLAPRLVREIRRLQKIEESATPTWPAELMPPEQWNPAPAAVPN